MQNADELAGVMPSPPNISLPSPGA